MSFIKDFFMNNVVVAAPVPKIISPTEKPESGNKILEDLVDVVVGTVCESSSPVRMPGKVTANNDLLSNLIQYTLTLKDGDPQKIIVNSKIALLLNN